MEQVRCVDCRREWAATEPAHLDDPGCPFCGSAATRTSRQVLDELGRRSSRGWLLA